MYFVSSNKEKVAKKTKTYVPKGFKRPIGITFEFWLFVREGQVYVQIQNRESERGGEWERGEEK